MTERLIAINPNLTGQQAGYTAMRAAGYEVTCDGHGIIDLSSIPETERDDAMRVYNSAGPVKVPIQRTSIEMMQEAHNGDSN